MKRVNEEETGFKSENEKKSLMTKVLLDLIFVVLLFFLIFVLYLLYQNIPRAPQNINVDLNKPLPIIYGNKSQLKVSQFYPNMKFNHKDLSYRINIDCNEQKKQKMIKAFEEITNYVPALSFKESISTPDIMITCDENSKEKIDEKHFIAGEGGAKKIVPTDRYHIINNGVVYLYEEKKPAIKCDYPNIELHELLHVFGFEHSGDKQSIMFPILEDCNQAFDQSIIDELVRLYSEENLPDLYFQNITLTKKGKYIDYNITIKNSGSIDSRNTTLNILEDDKVIETTTIDSIGYGAGIILKTTNLRLRNLTPKKISFIIDKDNRIREIDKINNEAVVKMN